MAAAKVLPTIRVRPVPRTRRLRRRLESAGWYVVLVAMSVVTVFPFAWMLLTSLKGPGDPIFSVPPQLIPADPTLANYTRVLDTLPVPSFFLNSIIVSSSVTVLSTLVSSLAAYPLAKMRFKGREAIFYLWKQAFTLSHAGYASAIAIVLLVVTLAFSILNVRLLERRAEGE